MGSKSDGMNYFPEDSCNTIIEKGSFKVGVIGLAHGHIYGQCEGLKNAGAEITVVYDDSTEKIKQFQEKYPHIKIAQSREEVLKDTSLSMIASADIASERGPLGVEALKNGKHYFSDKPSFTTLSQLELARKTVKETGKRFFVYYSERLHNKGALFAGDLVHQGAIGRVIHMSGMGPHRISLSSRPPWFFEKDKYGGILCDIGSHQIEQFLYYTGATDAVIEVARVANYNNKSTPGLQDFGDLSLSGNNGTTAHIRLDWFTPDALDTWGDGRTFLLGTEGYIEVRKYTNICEQPQGDIVYLITKDKMEKFEAANKRNFTFFGDMILDCINKTENAMTQEHIFKAMEIALLAQSKAIVLE